MAKQSAADFVRAVLEAVLPDGVPPSWVSIDEAHYVGFGRNAVAYAAVSMFDGLPAKVEVQRWGESHRHRWTDMPGGDASFEDGKWVRVQRTPTDTEAADEVRRAKGLEIDP